MLARTKLAMSRLLPHRARLPLFSITHFMTYNPVLQRLVQAPTRNIISSPSSIKYQSTMGELLQNSSVSSRELFSYTSGRYLYNEKLRLAERYVELSVEALQKVAAQSVTRDRVVDIRKLAEGGFNRVLLLTMEDGLEVIVKIPFSISVPRRLATESEVATLDFLRSKGIAVPQVYAWSSHAENDVGCEYIVMEKAAGKPLKENWFDLTYKEQIRLATSYVDIERKLFSIPFGSYGSIYYKDSLPQNLQANLYATRVEDVDRDADRFCIGPVADYMFWRGKRAQLAINRGPCELLLRPETRSD